ncbi:hypothetical protein F511_39328 [Dorcoceras hygrometricum]|uniref:Uncharacterized protein n=1 Tax=Dorcoceras hygrometricum TaxID=472368 RepID=A0A2Z7ANZ7_9LAMI|nr:hypothetical protein F511_39328 [Dorcoceras hygrometricum]
MLRFLNIKILEHRRQIWKVPQEDESPSLAPDYNDSFCDSLAILNSSTHEMCE